MPAKPKAKKPEDGASPVKEKKEKKPVDKKKKAERELKKLDISDKWKAEDGSHRDKIGVKRFSLGKMKPASVPPPIIKKGKGSKLKNIAHVEAQIKKRAQKDTGLNTLHRLVLGKVGKHTEVKDNLRAFSGVVYNEEDGFTKEKLQGKLEDYKLNVLKDLCKLLCLDPSGKREELVDRIMEMLEKPKESGYSPRKRAASPGKKSPSKKHKGERTRPLSGYIFFCKDKRSELAKEHPDEPVTEISKRLGKLWKKLSEKDRAPYEAKAKADKKRLEKASPKKKKKPAKKSPKKAERSESEKEEAESGSGSGSDE